ncbi:UPF0554 protein [Arachis hypogaea]|nr:UPF0554 protein [Arachis hypogaea]
MFRNYEKINPRMCRNSTTSLKIHTRNHSYKSEILEIHAVALILHVLFVPGNPGVILFYKDFVEFLYNQLEGNASITGK